MKIRLKDRVATCVATIVLVLGGMAPLGMAGDASFKTGRFNLHREGAGPETPGGWLQLKLCLMPESKLKFIEAGETLRPVMKRAFRDGNMHPDQFIEQVSRLTGYKAEDIRRGEGFACYAYFTYLPSIAEYLATEGAVDPASDTGGAPTAGDNGLNTAPFADGLVMNEGVFDARVAFKRAKDKGLASDESDFATFRNFSFIPAVLRFVESTAANSLREAAVPRPNAPAAP